MAINYQIFLFFALINLIFSNESKNKTSKFDTNSYVVCDMKTSGHNRQTGIRENLCKIECFTKHNNPGLCQIQLLNPCKTLDSEAEPQKCKSTNNQNSRFQSICCPFKRETQITKPIKPENSENEVLNESNNNKDFECGKRPDIAAIVGGFDSMPNTWPWIVSIYERPTPRSQPRFICGGAIISDNYILSAAHCFVRSGADSSRVLSNRFLVKLGAYRLSDRNIKFKEISQIIVHKKYNSIQHYNDIALIRVKTPIEFNPTVAPICLPNGQAFNNRDFVGKRVKLVGWGATRFGGQVSDELQEVDVNIIDNRDCNRNYSQIYGHNTGFPNGINTQLLCAGVMRGGKDSCQGDSGGPLALEMDDKWYELGIVSFGYKCAEPGYPGVYTRVRQFIDWINSNTK